MQIFYVNQISAIHPSKLYNYQYNCCKIIIYDIKNFIKKNKYYVGQLYNIISTEI